MLQSAPLPFASASVRRSPTAARFLLPVCFFAVSALFAPGCGPATDAPAPEAEPTTDPLARTADPGKRGLAEADFPRIQELAPGVYSYEQLRSAGDELFTTVSMFVVTGGGVLVADGQGSVEETARLVSEIGRITDEPITHVVVSSDHGDHTAGNSAFPDDAHFIAHPTSVEALRRMAENLPEGAPEMPMPGTIVAERLDLTLGDRRIDVLFLGRAHTGGDLAVHLPEDGVLFLSEAYLHRVFPAMRSAYPTEWVAMLRRAKELGARINVPGHGFVDDPDTLRAELDVSIAALEQVIAEATRLHGMGLSAEEAAAQADFGDLETWSLRDSQAARAIGRVYMELNGELPE